MPVVFKERGFRFHFYSFEGSPREPVHIHVQGKGADAKFRVGEDVVLAYNHGLNSRDLAMVRSSSEHGAPTSRKHGMDTLVSPTAVRFDEATMWVSLSDGRTLGMPLAWYPRLLGAPTEELVEVEMSPSGLHWDALDEDLSIDGMLRGLGARSQRNVVAA